ncbi:MAG: energy transducer TonB [Gemmatimonadetes bacterium]|nr:energy transducer TonB [Gemmatimonadota bacterium]
MSQSQSDNTIGVRRGLRAEVPLRLLLGLGLALLAGCVRASQLPPLDDQVREARQVDRMAAPMAHRRLPEFPDVFWNMGMEGDVRVRYVVDASGHPVPSSFTVVHAAHELFSRSIWNVFAGWQFTPAELHGRRVAVRYEEVFAFRVPREFDYAPERPSMWTDTVRDAVPRTVAPLARLDTVDAARLSAEDLREAQRSALGAIAADSMTYYPQHTRDTVTLCVSMREGAAAVPADAETLRRIGRPNRRAVSPIVCPRTYQGVGSPFGNFDPPAPAGWIDPYRIDVGPVKAWARDDVRIWATVAHGTRTEGFKCLVSRDPSGGSWGAHCISTVLTTRVSSSSSPTVR